MLRKALLTLSMALLLSCEPVLKESTQPSPPIGAAGGVTQVTTPPNPCTGCALAPTTFTRSDPQVRPYVREFSGDPAASYLLIVQDDGQDGTAAEIKLNGEVVVPVTALRGLAVAEVKTAVTLSATNRLTVLPVGKVGAKVVVWILEGAASIGTSGGLVMAPGGQVSLAVPSGALAGLVDIHVVIQHSLPAMDTARFSPLGMIITLLPDTLRFNVPVELRVSALSGATASSSIFQFVGDTLLVWNPGYYDAATDQIVSTLEHFSRWLPLTPKPFPDNASVLFDVTTPPSRLRGASPAMTSIEANAEVDRAIHTWGAYLANHGITFVAQRNAANPDIEIQFMPPSLYLGGSTLGIQLTEVIGFNTKTGRVAVLLNDTFVWRETRELVSGGWDSGDAFLQNVVQHELGHALGLSHYRPSLSLACHLVNGAPLVGMPDDCVQTPVMAALTAAIAPYALDCLDLGLMTQAYPLAQGGAGCATQLIADAGDGQTAPVGGAVPIKPAVKVMDASGNPVSGVTVLFRASPGQGTVTGGVTITDSNGIASPLEWRLGQTPGSYRLDATVEGGGFPNFFDGHQFQATAVSGGTPGTLVYSDDFSGGLGNWVEIDPDGYGSWTTQNGELFGDYNIGCGSPTCNQTQLLLADALQPVNNGYSNWRMEVQSGLVQAYCCFNGGAMVNLGKFALYVSNAEKEQFDAGWVWNFGLQPPLSLTTALASHQAYPWTQIGYVTPTVPSWNPHQWQTVILEKVGNQYTTYFKGNSDLSPNGVQMYSVSRTFSGPVKIGFSTYGGVRMDNFKLYRLP